MTLRSLLGKNYKWWYIVLFYYKTHITYLGDTLIRGIAEFFGLASSIFIWYITTNSNSSFNTNEIITYLLIGFIYTAFTSSWYAEDLGYEIKNGSLNKSMIIPTPKFIVDFLQYIGRGVFAEILTTFIPVIVLLPYIYQYIYIPTFANLAWTILFIPISYSIKHIVEQIVGTMGFWLTNFGGLLRLKAKFEYLLNGSKIPLNILSNYIWWCLFTPFAFILHYPVQIYLGKYSQVEILQTFGGGIGWCFVLFILARIVFKMGLKRNEAVGL